MKGESREIPCEISGNAEPSTGDGAKRRPLWPWLAAAFFIALVGLGIRGWLHQQPYNSDDIQYFAHAQEISLPSLSNVRFEKVKGRINANSLRFVFLGVPASTTALLGNGPEGFYGAIYAVAGIFFVGIFSLAWILSGPRVAVVAGGIWTTSYVAIAVDTRLVPDNLGTGLALIGLALIAYVAGLGLPNGIAPPGSRRRRVALAFVGGFLLWAAFSTRASFFVFALVGVSFALLGRERWFTAAAVTAGGIVGQLVEFLYFSATIGDPFVRWRALLGFGSSMTKAGTNPDSVYAGYSVGDLFTRYPRILWESGSAEIVLHVVGLCIFVWWAVGWRKPNRLAKAVCGFLIYGFLTFAITRVDPVVPLMREKIRYYATAAPLFYIAVAEIADWVVFGEVKLTKLNAWLNGRTRLVVAALLVVSGLAANLVAGADSAQFAKNGNDGLLTAAEVLEADAARSGRPKVLYQDMRTSRVMDVLLPADEGWVGASGYDSYLGADFKVREDGYLLLNWKRLNANVRRQFGHAPRTHNYYRVIERHPLVARHRRGGELVDVFFVGKRSIERQSEVISQKFPVGWSRYSASTKSVDPLPASPGAVFAEDSKARQYIYSGEGPLWAPATGTRLGGDRYVQALIVGRADHMKQVLVYLYWWREGSRRATRQYMGRFWVGPNTREYSVWTYLPQDARAHRLVLRGDPGVQISSVTTRTLGLHPDDRVQEFGGAWPRASTHPGLVAAAEAIRRDARSTERPRVIYDELHADRVRRLLANDKRWTLMARQDVGGHVLPPSNSYLILSWKRLQSEAIESGSDDARVHRYYRALGDKLLVFRHWKDHDYVDVFFAPREPVTRPVESVETGFPRGWTRLLNSTKTWQPIEATGEMHFESENPKDEYVYSGSGPVWRATVEDTRLAGDQFVELIFEGQADAPTFVRAAIFWWPEGSKEPRRQPMGRVVAGPTSRQFALWTYLPARATSSRWVLRSKAGVTISDVRTRTLGRLEGDRLEQEGGAW